jgi:hypothetical protein
MNMISVFPRARRNRAAFVLQRIALPERLLKDGWWLCPPGTQSSPAAAAAEDKHQSDIRCPSASEKGSPTS